MKSGTEASLQIEEESESESEEEKEEEDLVVDDITMDNNSQINIVDKNTQVPLVEAFNHKSIFIGKRLKYHWN